MPVSRPVIAAVGLVCTYPLVSPLTNSWVQSGDGYELGNRRRIISMMKIQWLLTFVNLIVYNQLMEWFEQEEKMGKVERRRKQIVRARFSVLLILFLFAGQAMYFLYYAPGWLQWLFFDLTTVCSGVWTNLAAFVVGFFLANLFRKWIFEQTPPTRCMLEVLSRIRPINTLIYDRKAQIKFSLVVSGVLSLLMWTFCDTIAVKERTIEIKNFSASTGKLRVAVVSDIHAGASIYSKQVEMVADRILSLDVDAVFMIGDMVDGTREDIQDRVEPFFTIPQRFPTFFVTGNHDYYYGNVNDWIQLYRSKGINVLNNNSTMFKGICIAGVNDLSSGKMGIKGHNMNASVALDRCANESTKILLSHNPASTLDILPEDLKDVDLMLSGHTHAGQFYVMFPLVYTLLPYYHGMYSLPGADGKLMVSAGTLYQGPNMKMLGMSEIWVLTLTGVKN